MYVPTSNRLQVGVSSWQRDLTCVALASVAQIAAAVVVVVVLLGKYSCSLCGMPTQSVIIFIIWCLFVMCSMWLVCLQIVAFYNEEVLQEAQTYLKGHPSAYLRLHLIGRCCIITAHIQSWLLTVVCPVAFHLLLLWRSNWGENSMQRNNVHVKS